MVSEDSYVRPQLEFGIEAQLFLLYLFPALWCYLMKFVHLLIGFILFQLAEIVNQGKLVSDEIILNLLSKRLESGEAKGEAGFILDGFPRTVRQAVSIHLIFLHKILSFSICLCFTSWLWLSQKILGCDCENELAIPVLPKKRKVTSQRLSAAQFRCQC